MLIITEFSGNYLVDGNKDGIAHEGVIVFVGTLGMDEER